MSDRSPTSLLIGRGSFLIKVGKAIICSSLAKDRFLVDVNYLKVIAPLELGLTYVPDVLDCPARFGRSAGDVQT